MLLTESEKAKQLLQRIITCYLANEDYPEDLKLEIIHAIDDQQANKPNIS